MEWYIYIYSHVEEKSQKVRYIAYNKIGVQHLSCGVVSEMVGSKREGV